MSNVVNIQEFSLKPKDGTDYMSSFFMALNSLSQEQSNENNDVNRSGGTVYAKQSRLITIPMNTTSPVPEFPIDF